MDTDLPHEQTNQAYEIDVLLYAYLAAHEVLEEGSETAFFFGQSVSKASLLEALFNEATNRGILRTQIMAALSDAYEDTDIG